MTRPELLGRRVVLRETRDEDVPALRAQLLTPEVAAWWGPPWPEFPFEDDEHHTPFTVRAPDGTIAGLIQSYEEPEPAFRHATIDLFVAPPFQRQGLGTDAIRTLVRHLVEDRGHHRITIDPAAANVAAVRCYAAIGFRPVGTLRAYWRDPGGVWRDGLLMELIVPPPGGRPGVGDPPLLG